MLNVIMLSVANTPFMLSGIMLNAIMLSVVMLNVMVPLYGRAQCKFDPFPRESLLKGKDHYS